MKFKNHIDVSDIGQVVDKPQQRDELGNVTQPTKFKNGHFVVTVEPVEEWAKWLYPTTTPPRVFMGRAETSTIYKFPSKQAFLKAFDQEADEV